MAGEQIEASTTTRSATVRYRTVPGEVYEASKDYCTVRAGGEEESLPGKSTATVRYSYCRSRGEAMSPIFQKNATKFETRITRHETIRHDSVYAMLVGVSVYSPILSTKIRCF